MIYHNRGGSSLASFGIGAKLRQERLGKGLAIDDIARETRIAPRFLEAIEADDFESLPGLVFTRNFVRQYALTLKLDPDPLLAELPKPDESTVQLPNPPARARSSYHRDRRLRSLLSSTVWLLLAGGAGVGCIHAFQPFARGRTLPTSLRSPPVTQTHGSRSNRHRRQRRQPGARRIVPLKHTGAAPAPATPARRCRFHHGARASLGPGERGWQDHLHRHIDSRTKPKRSRRRNR